MAAFSRGKQLCFLSSHTLRPHPQSHPHYLLPFQQLLRQSTSSKRKNAIASPGSKKGKPPTAAPKIIKSSAKTIPHRTSYDSNIPHPSPSQHGLKPGQEKVGSQVANPRLTGLSPASINPHSLHTLLDVPEKIYQAPPHKLYVFSSYTLASFFMLYGGYASTLWTNPPDVGLHWTIPVAYGVGSVALVGVGSFTLSNTTGLVKSMTAVPVKHSNRIDLKIEGSKWVPWRTKSVTCGLGNCYFDNEIGAVLAGNAARGQRKPLGETNVFIRPWVWMGRGILDFFLETKSMFLREHMVGLIIEDGGKWKVDTRGMALGGAEGLDRLIPAERDTSRMTWLVQAGVFIGSVTIVYMVISAYRKYKEEQDAKEKELLEKIDAQSV